jgi:WD40 repeat protein
MENKIIEDVEQSLDELIARARNDKLITKIVENQRKPVIVGLEECFFRKRPRGKTKHSKAIAISPDNRHVAEVWGKFAIRIQRIDMQRKTEPEEYYDRFADHEHGDLDFSPCGKYLACVRDDKLEILELDYNRKSYDVFGSTDDRLFTHPYNQYNRQIRSVSFVSEDKVMIASEDVLSLCRIDYAAKQISVESSPLPPHKPKNMTKFDYNGRYNFCTIADNPLFLHELRGNKWLQGMWAEVPGDGNKVNDVSIDPTGTYVAVGSKDGFVRIFQISGGKEILKKRLAPNVNGVAFSKDGSLLAAVARNNSMKVYKVNREWELR